MLYKHSKGLLWIGVILLVCACTTFVEVQLPAEKPKIVVNCLFHPDSLWTVQLGTTRAIFDTNPYVGPQSAQVHLYEGGVFLERLEHRGKNRYTSLTYQPQPGKLYALTVIAPAFDTVSTYDQLPPQARITALMLRDGTPTFLSDAYTLEVSLRDVPAQEDFYNLVVYLFDDHTTTKAVRLDSINVDDPTIAVPTDLGRGLTFSDRQFDGRAYTIRIYADQREIKAHSGLVVELRSISKALYQYETSLYRQLSSRGDPFAEPAGVFSNIEKGYGIFAGYQVHRDTLRY